jgi:hypothetical protein
MCIGGTRNLRVNMLIVNCELDIAVFSCKAKPLETLPALAVRVTAWADVNDDTVAVNPALVALAGTTSVAGTVTAALLLVRMTYVSDSLAENVDCFRVAGRHMQALRALSFLSRTTIYIGQMRV